MEFNLLQIPSYVSVIIFFVVIFSQVDLKSTPVRGDEGGDSLCAGWKCCGEEKKKATG